jgi:hypothetical protein
VVFVGLLDPGRRDVVPVLFLPHSERSQREEEKDEGDKEDQDKRGQGRLDEVDKFCHGLYPPYDGTL